MAYPRKLLNRGEHVNLDLHPHWVVFVKPGVISVLLLVLVTTAQRLDDGWFKTGVTRVLLIGLLVSVGAVVVVALKWSRTFFVVTSQRVIFRQGVLSRRGVEIPLDRVNNVNFAQSFLERMLGAGDLLIESASEDGQQLFSDIRNPEQVQNLIHDAIQSRTGREASADPPISQLERLEAMLHRGSITQSEFDEQKRRLLH
ncbi:MAG: PH domain-containing protein [Acidimicrobiaceae bacterium]|nr:PH domain-containing protein [Acidimicrobiaceae bacterium]